MTVSKVREGLTKERLGPSWGLPEQADSPQRAEALAWARRQLAWERRLADLQDSGQGPTTTDCSTRGAPLNSSAQTAQGE